MSESTGPLLLTIEEGAKKIRVSRTKLFELMATGEIQSVKIGRSRRVPTAALDEYVARLLAEQAGDRAGRP